MKFERITIEGYRRLSSVQLEMRPLTVAIGANGVGKTSFLEIFSLLAASAKGQLQSKISDLSGLSEIVTRDRADRFSISLAISWPNGESLDYFLHIAAKGQFYEIEIEAFGGRIREKNNNLVGVRYIDSRGGNIQYYNYDYDIGDIQRVPINWEHNAYETSLSQTPKTHKKTEIFRRILASCNSYSAWQLNVGSKSPIRLPQSMRPATLPGSNGEDLVSCLYYLRETAPERFEIIEDTLAAGFADFEKLSFPPVAAGTLAMTWKDKNFSQPLYMHQLSEGTLRFLWLIAILISPDLTAVTLIDEPEVSLHPELLQLLAELMRETSQRTQLIVATYSDRLIRFLEPHEVLVCDAAEDGTTTMTWADSLDLDKWLEDYSLDEILAMNLMGGRS